MTALVSSEARRFLKVSTPFFHHPVSGVQKNAVLNEWSGRIVRNRRIIVLDHSASLTLLDCDSFFDSTAVRPALYPESDMYVL